MAEILLWVTVPPDVVPVAQAPLLWAPGDVISVCPDGHGWGRKEVANDRWRIWQMPGVDVARFMDLVDEDVSCIAGASFSIRMRVRYVDLTSVAARVLVGRGQVMKLDAVDTRRVISWKRTRQTLGMVG